MQNTETLEAIQQANAFIAAEEEYLPLPQMDGTDVMSADPNLTHSPPLQRFVGTRASSGYLVPYPGRAFKE